MWNKPPGASEKKTTGMGVHPLFHSFLQKERLPSVSCLKQRCCYLFIKATAQVIAKRIKNRFRVLTQVKIRGSPQALADDPTHAHTQPVCEICVHGHQVPPLQARLCFPAGLTFLPHAVRLVARRAAGRLHTVITQHSTHVPHRRARNRGPLACSEVQGDRHLPSLCLRPTAAILACSLPLPRPVAPGRLKLAHSPPRPWEAGRGPSCHLAATKEKRDLGMRPPDPTRPHAFQAGCSR